MGGLKTEHQQMKTSMLRLKWITPCFSVTDSLETLKKHLIDNKSNSTSCQNEHLDPKIFQDEESVIATHALMRTVPISRELLQATVWSKHDFLFPT